MSRDNVLIRQTIRSAFVMFSRILRSLLPFAAPLYLALLVLAHVEGGAVTLSSAQIPRPNLISWELPRRIEPEVTSPSKREYDGAESITTALHEDVQGSRKALYSYDATPIPVQSAKWVRVIQCLISVAPNSAGAVDKSWKALIEGKAHGTTPGHKVRTYREAINMAKSGQYEKVYINKGYRATTGVKVSPNRRPDVTGIRKTGEVDVIEVPQATDTRLDLEMRNRAAQDQLPLDMQGRIRIEDIR